MVKILHSYAALHFAMYHLKGMMDKKSLRGYPKGSFCVMVTSNTFAVCTDIKFNQCSIVVSCYPTPQQGKLNL